MLRRRSALALLVVLAAIAPYLRTFDVPFQFDDAALEQDPTLHALELSPAALAPAVSGFPLHRWLSRLTLAVNYAIGGRAPAGYHLFNLAIHALVALLVLALAAEILARTDPDLDPARRGRVALLAALLFAVHPLQTMAVTYVIQRMAALAALFALAALLAWARGRAAEGPRRGLWFAGAALAALLAVGSKENAVVLPLLVLAFEAVAVGGLAGRLRRHPLPVAAAALALVALTAAAALAYRGVLAAEMPLGAVPLLDRLLTQPRVLLLYLARLALPWPGWLHLAYDLEPSRGLLDPPGTLAALLLVAGLAAGAVALRRRLPLVAFGVAFFLLALVVEQSILPLDLVFEHRVYLPSFGLLLAAAWGLERAGARLRWGTWSLAAPLLLALAAGTVVRNEQWRDPVSLQAQDVAAAPGLARPLLNLGAAYHERGDFDREAEVMRRLLAVDPRDARAWSNLAQLALIGRRPLEALELSTRAVELSPTCAPCRHNQALALLEAGFGDRALEAFRETLRLAPQDVASRTLVGVLLIRRGRAAEAVAELRRALAVDPAYTLAWVNLAAAHRLSGERAAAVEAARRAVELDPTAPPTRQELDRALGMAPP